MSGVVALFGVTVREDADRDVWRLIGSLRPVPVGAGTRACRWRRSTTALAVTNGVAWQQSMDLHGKALAGGNLITADLDLSRSARSHFLWICGADRCGWTWPASASLRRATRGLIAVSMR